MSTLNDLYDSIYAIARKVVQKGGVIQSSNISPSFDDIKNGIASIPQAPVTNLSGTANIVVAEMPNTTFVLEDEYGTTIETKTNDTTNGGSVTFAVSTFGNYRITAYDSNSTQLWTKLIGVPNGGIFNCKSGKVFADYTPAEVNTAAKNDYAKIMWSVGDSRNITTVGSSKKWVIGGFNHYLKADKSGYTGLTLVMQSYTGSSYKHNTSNDNTIGWEGSTIRQNGLADGDVYYMKATVDENTSGTYYCYNTLTDTWDAKTLPADYDANEYYYTQNTKSGDGAFITGLPDWKNYIVQVITSTADAGSGYKKIINSKDRVFLLSDAEVFGSTNRYSRYSRYEYEGSQLEYFAKDFSDGKIRLGNLWWLRCPYSSSATAFCYVDIGGGVNSYNASSGYSARLVINL